MAMAVVLMALTAVAALGIEALRGRRSGGV
jgi:hypothetical protein